MLWNVMAILWLLLKVVGILLLILLFLVVLILFVSLRYRVYTSFYEEKRVRGRVSWLWFVVRAVFLWEEGALHWKLCVFGIPIMSGDENGSASSHPEKNKRKKRNKKRKDAKNKQKVIEDQREDGSEQNIGKEQENIEQEQTDKQSNEAVDASSSGPVHPSQEKVPANPGKRRGIIARLRRLWTRIMNFFRTLKKLFRLLRQKVHSLHDLADMLREEETRHSICIVKDNMIHLWKQIHPRKIRGDIVFGTGDPCTTGQALGGIAVLYGWIGSGVHIVPDFQEKRLEGRLDVRGRIRIISLIVIIVKMMFHREFKQLWQKLEQWKEDF